MSNIILTADRPTGRLHIGHYVGSLRERVRLQNETQYDELFVMIADAQALTDNYEDPLKVRNNVMEVMLDYLAVGLDPQKTTFCVQSGINALGELTLYFMNLVTMPRLLRNPTVKTEVKLKKFEHAVPVGFVNYPISQAADIAAFKANLIPVGDDQEPMLEQTREIVRSFNRIYKTDVLVECKSVRAKNEDCTRLPGTDGNAKMSKSLGNCIYISDEPEVIKKKVNSIKTFPRAIEEPGILEGNILFVYLNAFCEDYHFAKYYPEFKNLNELKCAYTKGGIGDGKIKAFLNNIIQEELEPIRLKRKQWENKITEVLQILKDGTKKANLFADKTLHEVKQAMGIGYFLDDCFEKEQINKYLK